MIDDRMEEGLSEEEAVAKIGSVSDILSQMNRPSVTRIGRTTSAKNKSENKNKGLITALVVMASPIWISLLAVWFSLVVSAVAVIWSLWISFIAVEVAFAASGLYGIVRHPMYAVTLLLFLAMPIVLGSLISFVVFLVYPLLIAKRIKNEEMILERDLTGYKEYKTKVKYRLIPFIW